VQRRGSPSRQYDPAPPDHRYEVVHMFEVVPMDEQVDEEMSDEDRQRILAAFIYGEEEEYEEAVRAIDEEQMREADEDAIMEEEYFEDLAYSSREYRGLLKKGQMWSTSRPEYEDREAAEWYEEIQLEAASQPTHDHEDSWMRPDITNEERDAAFREFALAYSAILGSDDDLTDPEGLQSEVPRETSQESLHIHDAMLDDDVYQDDQTWVFGHDASAYQSQQQHKPPTNEQPTFYSFIVEEDPMVETGDGYRVLVSWTYDGVPHPNRQLPVHVPDKPWSTTSSHNSHDVFATLPAEGGPRGPTGLGKRPYKSALLKVKPINMKTPEEYRIVRRRPSDPMLSLPPVPTHPGPVTPTAHMTKERMDGFDLDKALHLWPEERKLFRHILAANEEAFAWVETERRRFRSDYFPPVKLTVTEHKPWCRRHVPIPPAIRDKVIELFKQKIKAGVYEESTSSYRNSWFCVVKKDGKSLRIVHDLQPLNEHVIRDARLVPQPDEFSEECAGRTLLSTLDLYSSFDLQLLDPDYRDLTTFQWPGGVLRNVGLPQGYSNSVAIQQANVTFILQPEIPESANAFVDNVIVKGTRTNLSDEYGICRTIPENSGIREYVWVHALRLNRVLHRIGRAGGSISGKKAVIAVESAVVVGYRCGKDGRLPEQGNVDKITNWPIPTTVTEVRGFLGTAAVSKLWIKDFGRIARPLYDLTKKGIDFVWMDDCTDAMAQLKHLVANAPGLKPIDYQSENNVILAVDSSHIGVGYIVSQVGPDKKRYPSRFGSITWNDVERRYSQAKLELHGLFRALHATRLHIYGVKLLIVEVDAKYIKGMLNNPDMQPNATINRWIAGVLLFNPTIVHVPATKHTGADGLSRRPFAEGDVDEVDDPDEWLDEQLGLFAEEVAPRTRHESHWVHVAAVWQFPLPPPSIYDVFAARAAGTQQSEVPRGMARNTRAAKPTKCAERAAVRDLARLVADRARLFPHRQPRATETAEVSDPEPEEDTQSGEDDDDDDDEEQAGDAGVNPEYPADRQRRPTHVILKEYQQVETEGAEIPRGKKGRRRDAELPVLQRFIETGERDRSLNASKVRGLVKKAAKFVVIDRVLYRREESGQHRRVVITNDDRLRVMKATHDSLGHKGFHPVRVHLHVRFWWPDMDVDIRWFLQSCHHCQVRETGEHRLPQVVPVVPSLFTKIHVDVMQMSVSSGGKTTIVQGRCALTSYPEWRTLAKIDAKSIAKFLYEDILCRWGTIEEIVTDNGPEVQGAVEVLLDKYCVDHIKISSYNKRANGLIERKHYDVRESLMKSCEGNPSRWIVMAPLVFWAERVTVKTHLGMSPFQMAHGVQPILPLDLAEATWLVPPLRTLTQQTLKHLLLVKLKVLCQFL